MISVIVLLQGRALHACVLMTDWNQAVLSGCTHCSCTWRPGQCAAVADHDKEGHGAKPDLR